MKPYIIAYVNDRSLPDVTPEDARRLSHINIAFGTVTPGGLLNESGLTHMSVLPAIREWNPEIKIVLSVGGWGAGNFSTMAMTDEGRRAFARSCRAYADRFGLDGIDIDWEYPCYDGAGIDADPSDREHFTMLLQALRDELGSDRILSIAAGAGDGFIRDTEMDKVAKICDYVQLMTYDMRNGFMRQAGHHTALYPSAADGSGADTQTVVAHFAAAGVPLEKMIIGAAFYARRWDDVPDVNHGLFQPAGTVGGFGARYGQLVDEFINKNGWTRYWDDEAKAPYLFNGSSFQSYDDPESLTEKCAWLTRKGLLGIMFWEYGCDTTHTLVKTLAENLS